VVTSDGWKVFQDVSREIRHLPNRLMREANLEDLQGQLPDIRASGREVSSALKREVQNLQNEVQEAGRDIPAGLDAWTSPPPQSIRPPQPPPAPPVQEPTSPHLTNPEHPGEE
jgi:hypothetical protein